MKTINASTFKAQCLALLDVVAATGESIRILKHGKAVAQVGPVSHVEEFSQYTLLGKGRIIGDVVGPVVPSAAWDADARNLSR